MVCPLQLPRRYDPLMHTAVASMRLFDGNNPVDPKLGKPVDLFRKGKAKFHMVKGPSPFGPLWFHIYESVIGPYLARFDLTNLMQIQILMP